ncbi:MAG TPA: peptide chain release factor N(5)-glutamine methyltransferase [Syntrophothermus lipocalidus]|uniref:Release factor glutamine methyltransferase n=1 Tax=Syntrophothermus lipocalidus (strain DSM 12680 / TGB-C1) TaxID=643648 RepID=D7CJT4_SYNLT|nr:peptide chain release factor N(5)-glutamine methyltransferase [Syntrophothermus lipocalidus]ADI03039.1 protein-(glutamine-N5) methyltransferase, release factor-specific [Syntrophothermus lipocalidus DSM 12680]HHV76269.1 peptide chain release factor N(5)-glutamine methyltransferase [Syntrophothermus lipocalidus]
MQEPWTVKSLLEWTTGYFRRKNIAEPRLEAELLLAYVLGIDRVGLYVNYYQPVNQDERSCYREIIKRRVQGEPVAYLTGKKEFFSLEFDVSPEVLIPRAETEVMVEKAIAIGRGMGGSLWVADVGTGCGAIAIALAVYLPNARIVAIDISSAAVELARKNARRYQVHDRIDFMVGDLLTPLGQDNAGLDIVVANLPYVPTNEWENLALEVKEFEPRIALDGGADGLAYYRRLMPQARQCLREGGYILVEIAWNQGPAMLSLMQHFFDEVEVGQDLAGRDRVVVGRKGAESPANQVL